MRTLSNPGVLKECSQIKKIELYVVRHVAKNLETLLSRQDILDGIFKSLKFLMTYFVFCSLQFKFCPSNLFTADKSWISRKIKTKLILKLMNLLRWFIWWCRVESPATPKFVLCTWKIRHKCYMTSCFFFLVYFTW